MSDGERIEQSNDVSALILDTVGVQQGHFIVLSDRFSIADALWAAGYRLTSTEYTAYLPNMPSGMVIDSDYSPHAVDATHRRQVYKGPYDRMPDGEQHDAGSITYGYGPLTSD